LSLPGGQVLWLSVVLNLLALGELAGQLVRLVLGSNKVDHERLALSAVGKFQCEQQLCSAVAAL
jgi:hypothetical protein